MEAINIILVEDQREVLQAVSKDLEFFEDAFGIEECESAAEAWDIMKRIHKNGDHVAVVISDHVMPGKSGVDFLIEVENHPDFKGTRKVLLTALATHQDTIQAINKASIDHYVEKPWKSKELIELVKTMLTEFILSKGIDYQPYLRYLNQELLFEKLRKET
jgi:two-component system, chemotaxis family, chemotaxis protein CheY